MNLFVHMKYYMRFIVMTSTDYLETSVRAILAKKVKSNWKNCVSQSSIPNAKAHFFS